MKILSQKPSLLMACSLSLALGGCVGESVSGDDDYYSGDWGSDLSYASSSSLDTSNYGWNSDYSDFTFSSGSYEGSMLQYELSLDDNSGYPIDSVDNTIYYDNLSYDSNPPTAYYKLVEGVCSSGQADVSEVKNTDKEGKLTVWYNNCLLKNAQGVTVNGGLTIIESFVQTGVNISTYYDSLSINQTNSDGSTNGFDINGSIKEQLIWDASSRMLKDLLTSSNLEFSVINNNKKISFNFSKYHNEILFDLNKDPVTYTSTENHTFDLQTPDYSGTITLKTEKPFKGDINGIVIDKGSQLVTDEKGNQERFKRLKQKQLMTANKMMRSLLNKR